ncbi:MAG: branched-chain amino acid ABC transporter ATP-binding protein/permease [Alphaproteobacteria bacterium]
MTLRNHIPSAAACSVLIFYATTFASSYDQRLLALSGVYVILVLGYQFIFGHAGALSLAQGSFFGAGAYATGILASRWDLGFLSTLPLSIAIAALLAALVAAPVLRLRTHYFALATLALAQLLLLAAVNWEGLTGGANGLSGVPPVSILGWQAQRGFPLVAVVWAIAGVAMLLARQQMNPERRAAFAIARETPLAAPAFGIDAGLLRFRAFLISAAFGGAAGALFVHTNRVVSPETLGFGVMVTCLTMTVVGGRTRIAGALIGALLLTHMPEWLRGLEAYYLVAMGALLLTMVLFAPDGLAAFLPAPKSQSGPAALPEHAVSATGFAGPPATLDASGLHKAFGGIRALDGLSLTLASGEIVGVIGPNGAGKTTLANALSGIVPPDAGTMHLAGRMISYLAPHDIARAGLTRTFQAPQLPSALEVREIIATARTHAGAQANAPTVEDALAFCGLADMASAPAGTLPHGLRRRVEICRAIVSRPSVLILDEPAAGLTLEEQAEIGTLCRALADAGMAILPIDHNVDFLKPIADRLVCMAEGRILAYGNPDGVLADPAVRAAYFGMDA